MKTLAQKRRISHKLRKPVSFFFPTNIFLTKAYLTQISNKQRLGNNDRGERYQRLKYNFKDTNTPPCLFDRVRLTQKMF